MPTRTTPAQLAIIGAGPVGLACALWLLKETNYQITLIDAKTPEAAQHDPRALALSWGSRQLLEGIHAWPLLATPIENIHVSQRGHLGRAVIHHEDHQIPALGYVVRYGDVVTQLAKAIRAIDTPRLTWLTEHTVTNTDASTGVVQMHNKSGTSQTIQADVIISAEGGLFHQQNHKGRQHDYQQTAIISTVTCSQPQLGWAWECFTQEGPLALLPHALHISSSSSPKNLPDGFSKTGNAPAWALVWCGTADNTAARMALNDKEFLQALGEAFGTRMGQFTWTDKRAAFPLGLNASETIVQERMVAIGNAAQTLHPVAGQGLNLGLRDAYCLMQALRLGTDSKALQQFSKIRQADRKTTIGLTDTLAHGFTENFDKEWAVLPGSQSLFGHLRGAALLAVDCFPPLKQKLARQMLFGRRT